MVNCGFTGVMTNRNSKLWVIETVLLVTTSDLDVLNQRKALGEPLFQRTRGNPHPAVFQRGAQAQNKSLLECGSYDLETDRHPGGAQPARQRERRVTQSVDAANQARCGQAHVLIHAAEPHGGVTD